MSQLLGWLEGEPPRAFFLSSSGIRFGLLICPDRPLGCRFPKNWGNKRVKKEFIARRVGKLGSACSCGCTLHTWMASRSPGSGENPCIVRSEYMGEEVTQYRKYPYRKLFSSTFSTASRNHASIYCVCIIQINCFDGYPKSCNFLP